MKNLLIISRGAHFFILFFSIHSKDCGDQVIFFTFYVLKSFRVKETRTRQVLN